MWTLQETTIIRRNPFAKSPSLHSNKSVTNTKTITAAAAAADFALTFSP
jgi:hypothetical protein